MSIINSDFMAKSLPLFAHANLFYAGILFYMVKEMGWTTRRILGILSMLVMVYPLHFFGGTARDFITPLEHISVTSLYFLLFFLVIAGRLKFLASRGLVFLGEISYSLYLIHQTLGFILIIFFMGLGVNFISAVTLATVSILLLSSFITFYIEKPATIKLRQFFKSRENTLLLKQRALQDGSLKSGYID